MGEHHVEVTLADWDVDRLAHSSAAVVEELRLIRELDEVAEVFDGCVPASVLDVVDEWGAVVRREHGGVAADLHAAGWVAGVLDVLARRRCLHDLTAHPTRESNPGSIDRGASRGEDGQRRWIVADLDTDLLEDRLGVALDDLQPFVTDDLERLHRSGQVGLGLDDMRGT